jgi:hypothetical protein
LICVIFILHSTVTLSRSDEMDDIKKKEADLIKVSTYNGILVLISGILLLILSYNDPDANSIFTLVAAGVMFAGVFMQCILTFAIISTRREMRRLEDEKNQI